ncbi:ABC transporter substrate-binding protein [Hydrogenovibrio halophilus]|uniref:ABC transporter substrate-binding protein n=1 Tax=Hydrogenovibrio halophilus TaxID=373391 RepID=UPI0003641BFA|nr:ABC transporter substrate-binding protein [Hydrogenovibrio halophilus]
MMPANTPDLSRRTLIKNTLLKSAFAGSALAGFGMTGGCEKRADSRFGIHTWIGYESLFLADQSGRLPPNITLSTGQNASDSINGLLSGELDGAALTLDEVLQVKNQGIPLQVVLVFNISAGADKVIARQPVASLNDIAGQRIAYEHSALGELMLSKLLDAADLQRDDVTLIASSPDRQLEQWQADAADILITYEPTASRLQAQGGQVIFDSRQLPETILDVLAVRSDRVDRFGDNLRDLIRAHFQVLDALQTNPGDTLYQIATRQNVALTNVREALRGVILPSVTANIRLLKTGGKVQTVADELVALMRSQALFQNDVTASLTDNLTTSQYLPKVIR